MNDTTLNNKANGCIRAEDSVAYLYGEMAMHESDSFETHLASCDVCVDEMAAVSVSHLSVYEWNRDVFAALETPPIAIPYTVEPAILNGVGDRYSLLDRVRAFLFSPAFAGGFAMLLIALAVIAIVRFDGTNSDQQFANLEPPQIESMPSGPLAIPSVSVNTATAPEMVATESSTRPTVRRAGAATASRTVEARSTRTRPTASRTSEVSISLPDRRETDDDSLRLSQMLDELGG